MLQVIITLYAACAILLLPATCLGWLPENHVALFVFGDSLLDAGNNVYLNNTSPKVNYYPYGETFFKHPTGRVCDGRIVPDFIAEYAKLPFIRPYLEPGFSNHTDGVNFASAGAGVLPETRPGTIHLKLQLSYFGEVVKRLRQQLGDEDAHKLLADAVYLFSMGGNDYMTVYTDSGSSVLKKTFVTMVLGNFTAVVKEVYALGGRKFAFQNVGPIGCMPATRESSGMDGCLDGLSELARMHNIALSKLLRKLAYQHAGFSYALFDYYTSLTMRTQYGSKFGFKEGESACCGSGAYNGNFTCGGQGGTAKYNLCGDPSKYVWFDAAHPTESANKQLANLLWNGPAPVVGPYNLKTFFNAHPC
ncbi:hypothetical protein BT93_I0857 [Corymbia citriodora subsp. variegata]|nr:hypothetical protein BT93_I0857 [Corymbia citriodora subsp. variegata]